MIKGKTKSGFSYTIDERVGSDWRIVKLINKAENGDPSERIIATSELVEFLLGENVSKLEAHIAKNNDGFIPMAALTLELFEIIESTKIKNLQSSQE